MVSPKKTKNKTIFIDTSALIGIFVKDDDFHKVAVDFWTKTEKTYNLVTSNFIFEEVATWVCYRKNKSEAIKIGNFLLENVNVLPILPILPEDEKKGWQLFCKITGRISFTDCTSFAIMKRLHITNVFTFDSHFAKAGFTVFP